MSDRRRTRTYESSLTTRDYQLNVRYSETTSNGQDASNFFQFPRRLENIPHRPAVSYHDDDERHGNHGNFCVVPSRNQRRQHYREPSGSSASDDDDEHSLARLLGNLAIMPATRQGASQIRESRDSPSPSSSSGDNDDEFVKRCLEGHNKYRARHRSPALILSTRLCKYASEWAVHLARRDTFEHRAGGMYGENLFMAWSSDRNHHFDGAQVVDDWYGEINEYVFGREPRNTGSVGHFTQVVWRASRKLGVAKRKSKSDKTIVVANYDPPGNVVGQFDRNVRPPN